jgi:hypothetical protein
MITRRTALLLSGGAIAGGTALGLGLAAHSGGAPTAGSADSVCFSGYAGGYNSTLGSQLKETDRSSCGTLDGPPVTVDYTYSWPLSYQAKPAPLARVTLSDRAGHRVTVTDESTACKALDGVTACPPSSAPDAVGTTAQNSILVYDG